MASTDVFPLDPNYAVRRGMISGVLEALADSGRRFGRQKRPNLRTWELEYRGRPTSEVEQLRAQSEIRERRGAAFTSGRTAGQVLGPGLACPR